MEGWKIKRLRKKLGLTLEKFAHKVGVSYSTVCRWENQRTKPQAIAIREIKRIAKKAEINLAKMSSRSKRGERV